MENDAKQILHGQNLIVILARLLYADGEFAVGLDELAKTNVLFGGVDRIQNRHTWFLLCAALLEVFWNKSA